MASCATDLVFVFVFIYQVVSRAIFCIDVFVKLDFVIFSLSRLVIFPSFIRFHSFLIHILLHTVCMCARAGFLFVFLFKTHELFVPNVRVCVYGVCVSAVWFNPFVVSREGNYHCTVYCSANVVYHFHRSQCVCVSRQKAAISLNKSDLNVGERKQDNQKQARKKHCIGTQR